VRQRDLVRVHVVLDPSPDDRGTLRDLIDEGSAVRHRRRRPGAAQKIRLRSAVASGDWQESSGSLSPSARGFTGQRAARTKPARPAPAACD